MKEAQDYQLFIQENNLRFDSVNEDYFRGLFLLYWGGFYEEILEILTSTPDSVFNSEGAIVLLLLISRVIGFVGNPEIKRLQSTIPNLTLDLLEYQVKPEFRDEKFSSKFLEIPNDNQISFLRIFDFRKIKKLQQSLPEELKSFEQIDDLDYLMLTYHIQTSKEFDFGNATTLKVLEILYQRLPHSAYIQQQYGDFLRYSRQDENYIKFVKHIYSKYPGRCAYYFKKCNFLVSFKQERSESFRIFKSFLKYAKSIKMLRKRVIKFRNL